MDRKNLSLLYINSIMNILDAYIKFHSQFIVVISGITGCGKTSIAKKLNKTFNIQLINQTDYYNIDKTL